MRKLIRFTSEEHVEEFLSGEVYMNSISYFWERGTEEQKDFSEGIAFNIPKDKLTGLSEDLIKVLCYDISIRAIAYKFSNICCFYRLFIDEINKIIQLPQSNITNFGSCAIIIENENKFTDRIIKSVRNIPGFEVTLGDVNYHKRTDSTNPNEKVHHTIDLKLIELIDINEVLGKNKFKKIKDSFNKIERYSHQQEWRISLFKNKKVDLPFKLDIGDISDIAYSVKTTDLNNHIITKYKGFRFGHVKDQRKPYQGTINRKQLHKKILSLDSKGQIMVTIG